MFDFHQPIFDSDGEFDEGQSQQYVHDLMAAFIASTEAQSLRDRQNWAQPMM